MLKKKLNNKKIVITIITAVILVLVILIVKFGQDESTGTESESNTGVKQEETYDGDGLEVEEDDQKTENSADTSEYWEDTEDVGNNKEQTNTKQEDVITGQPAGNKTEEPKYDKEVSDEDTPEDEKSWGAIY